VEEPRPEKLAVVEEVRSRLADADAAILTEYRGLKVGELAELRRSLRDVGGEYAVYKNTLVRFAVRQLELDGVEALLRGPTAIAFVDGDAAAVAKALRDYARSHPQLIVKGGVLGDRFLSPGDAGALAELPSREVLLSRLAGAMAAPMQQLAGLLQALPRNLAYGLQALIERSGGVEAAGGPGGGGPESPAPDAGAVPSGDRARAEGVPVSQTDSPPSEEGSNQTTEEEQ
jgi:large subunit ribosomal protein L10